MDFNLDSKQLIYIKLYKIFLLRNLITKFFNIYKLKKFKKIKNN